MAKTDDTPAPQPDLMALIAAMAANQAVLTEAVTRLANAGVREDSDERATLADALARMSEAQLKIQQQAETDQRRQVRPSNEVVHMRSVFNRRGHMAEFEESERAKGGPYADLFKPQLKCEMFVPMLIEWDSLTREEAQLLNLLEQGSYKMTLNDDEQVEVNIIMERKLDGSPSRLLARHDSAWNKENFRKIMPFAVWLREVLDQHTPEIRVAAAKVLRDKEEAALIASGKISVAA